MCLLYHTFAFINFANSFRKEDILDNGQSLHILEKEENLVNGQSLHILLL